MTLSLYERLPEIYRVKDAQQEPPYQLRSYLNVVERAFGSVKENIAQLYRDFFIETCDDWVVPYIGDLLGVSHLSGDPWTLRADVADAVAMRRRKGTLAGMELLTHNSTRWGVHCAELRKNLVWTQHLNNQRPDAGGSPPKPLLRGEVRRGGTATLRDPSVLSLLGTPFSPFAHVPDLKPCSGGSLNYNLPNLAVFLWRLKDYRVLYGRPLFHGVTTVDGVRMVGFHFHPMGYDTVLFNTYRNNVEQDPPVVTLVDQTPGPIPTARLSQNGSAGNPQSYLAIDVYEPDALNAGTFSGLDLADVGLQLHLPAPTFSGRVWPGSSDWRIRGADLCAWENGVFPSPTVGDIIIDPQRGRLIIAVSSDEEALALESDLLVTHTYGAPGPVGAHPVAEQTPGEHVGHRVVNGFIDPDGLTKSLENIDDGSTSLVVEIQDSLVHDLDPSVLETSLLNIQRPLTIRAAVGTRPIIRLASPLRFSGEPVVRLEGLYLVRSQAFEAGAPLIGQATDVLELDRCTLQPGENQPAIRLAGGEESASRVIMNQTLSGPVLMDQAHKLHVTSSILDAGLGVGQDPGPVPVVGDAASPETGWGPELRVSGGTFFGKVRVSKVEGRGGIWVHSLESRNHQKGCIRYSRFAGSGNRLPQNLGCVFGDQAPLRFTSERFGHPAYGQLAHAAHFQIRERGPGDNAMGAYGFLAEAHKWRNLQIRYREFMPVGVRPLLVPVT